MATVQQGRGGVVGSTAIVTEVRVVRAITETFTLHNAPLSSYAAEATTNTTMTPSSAAAVNDGAKVVESRGVDFAVHHRFPLAGVSAGVEERVVYLSMASGAWSAAKGPKSAVFSVAVQELIKKINSEASADSDRSARRAAKLAMRSGAAPMRMWACEPWTTTASTPRPTATKGRKKKEKSRRKKGNCDDDDDDFNDDDDDDDQDDDDDDGDDDGGVDLIAPRMDVAGASTMRPPPWPRLCSRSATRK